MNNNTFFLICGLIITSVFTSCCDDHDCFDPANPDCVNYDPCYGKHPPSAEFIMEEGYLSAEGRRWYADSTFLGAGLRFRSTLTDTKYQHTWYVGAEIFTGSVTPSRNFIDVARPDSIFISHVIEYLPEDSCFPNDDGKDSVVQGFALIRSLNDFKTYGTYRGALDGGTDTFEVQIRSIDINGNPAIIGPAGTPGDHYANQYINFHNRGETDTLTSTSSLLSIGSFLYNHHGNFDSGVKGTVTINPDNTFEMHYREADVIIGDGDWHYYRGRKLD